MASKKIDHKKKRPQRATSNVFAMFDQNQIQEFKEAFNMIDQDKDGFITKEDLADMFASLGKNPSEVELTSMLNDAGPVNESGQLNFTMFLTLFGVKMSGTDSEEVIKNAFSCFDETGSGYISEDKFKELLVTIGDRYTPAEVSFEFLSSFIYFICVILLRLLLG